VRTFVGNFQGTYVHPGNSWDLRACTQKPGESLWDFIRRFSKRCTELLSIAQSEIVHTFLEGTTCRDLMRELGRSPPVNSNELFDIATSFASGEEAVGAIFDGKKDKRVDDAPAEGSKSKECRMDLPGPTTSVGTRTNYSVGPWDYLACAARHLMA
jgi:hypothetical protein